jgi:hypothetical protein
MSVANRDRLLLLALAVLLTAVFALLLRDFSRQAIIVPLARLVWIVHVLLLIIPRTLLWVLFILLLLRIAWRSLNLPPAPIGERRPESMPPATGPVEAEMHWVRLAGEGTYGRWRLAKRLSDLATEMLAHREGVTLQETRRRLWRGELALPARVQSYLQSGLDILTAPEPGFSLWRRRDRQTEGARPLSAESAEEAIGYLEQQWEVRHGS